MPLGIGSTQHVAGPHVFGPVLKRMSLLSQAEQDEVAVRVIQWITSSGHVAPPSDLLPVKRHPLRRN